MLRQLFVSVGAIALLMLAGAGPGQAEDYPARPITVVVGASPGGVTDVTTRQYAELVSRSIGQQLVVENRAGAGGALAAAAVQNARPDGYTVLVVIGSQFAALPAIGPTGYDPIKGFTPVTVLFRLPTLVVVPYDSPAKSMADLLALGKKKPGGILLGSPGAGTPGHLLAARIGIGTHTPMQYVHYRGGAPLMTDLITGRIDFSFASYNTARPHIDAKKLRALAVDADQRISALPDVPTLVELGLGQYRVADWFGLVAPAKTPKPVIEKLNHAFVKAAHDPQLIKQLTAIGNVAASSTPEEMAGLLAQEVKTTKEIVNALGLHSSTKK
jgi:tripartite-type tricarboxylate transporter receptor subunit TctC